MMPRKNPPYIHTSLNAPYTYMNMLVAILPCILYAVFTYGLSAAILIGSSAILSLLISRISDKLKGKIGSEYYDLSALFNGIVLALLMPSGVGLIWILIGVFFSEVVFRQFFGGVGCNPVNAPIATVLLLNVVFPVRISGYLIPMHNRFDLDSLMKITGTGECASIEDLSFAEIFTGNYSGYLGIGCSAMILIGFIYLLIKRMIRVEAPLAYLAVVSIASCIINRINIFTYQGMREYLVFVSVSSILFVAVFLLTDLTGVAHGRLAGVISGVFCGVVTSAMLSVTNSIISICVPVILTNIAAFLIDYSIDSVGKKRGDRL